MNQITPGVSLFEIFTVPDISFVVILEVSSKIFALRALGP